MFLIRSAMTQAIDTLGKAIRHALVLQVDCQLCRRRRHFDLRSLYSRYGAGRDPYSIRFACIDCKKDGRSTLVATGLLPAGTVILHRVDNSWIGKPFAGARLD
jgi:hypothetical protein